MKYLNFQMRYVEALLPSLRSDVRIYTFKMLVFLSHDTGHQRQANSQPCDKSQFPSEPQFTYIFATCPAIKNQEHCFFSFLSMESLGPIQCLFITRALFQYVHKKEHHYSLPFK